MVTSIINTSETSVKNQSQPNFLLDQITSLYKTSDIVITSTAKFALNLGKNYDLKFRKDKQIKLFEPNDASDMQKLRILKTILAVGATIGFIALLNISLPILTSAVIISAQFFKENLLEVSTALGAVTAIDKQIKLINTEVETIKKYDHIIPTNTKGQEPNKKTKTSKEPITKPTDEAPTEIKTQSNCKDKKTVVESPICESPEENKKNKVKKVNGADEFIKFLALYKEIEKKS